MNYLNEKIVKVETFKFSDYVCFELGTDFYHSKIWVKNNKCYRQVHFSPTWNGWGTR